MKNYIALFLGLSGFQFAVAQRPFDQQMEKWNQELSAWDQQKGSWVAQSFSAYANQTAFPTRTFNEQHTLSEVLPSLPNTFQREFDSVVRAESSQPGDDQARWQRLAGLSNRNRCTPRTGRSYGDPHMVSYDNVSYSFQTVGEFTLTQSDDRSCIVQTRQRPNGGDFSLNTAVAMQVNGDRVTIYANEKPDGHSAALRVNGEPQVVRNGIVYLNHGGVIRYTTNQYQVTWPSGEKLVAEVRRNGSMGFLNITMEAYPCVTNYEGLLGNGNGEQADDFTGKDPNRLASFRSIGIFSEGAFGQTSRSVEEEYLQFLTRDFADDWRVTQATSLFEYAPGESTLSYTDYTYPRIHRTVNDMDPNQRRTAERHCRERGIQDRDLQGCIYDRGFLNIPPSPTPRTVDLGGRTIQTERVPFGRFDGGNTPPPTRGSNPGTIDRSTNPGRVNPDATMEERNPTVKDPDLRVTDPEGGTSKAPSVERKNEPTVAPVTTPERKVPSSTRTIEVNPSRTTTPSSTPRVSAPKTPTPIRTTTPIRTPSRP